MLSAIVSPSGESVKRPESEQIARRSVTTVSRRRVGDRRSNQTALS